MKKTLNEIAALVQGTIINGNGTDGGIEITGVTNIDDASPSDITFAVPPHIDKAAKCNAAAVIVPETLYEFSKPAIRVANPRIAFTTLLKLYTPKPTVKPGVHPGAVIGENVRLGNNVSIMPYAIIDENTEVGDNTIIYPHAYIGTNCKIGADTLIYPQAVIRENCIVGDRVIINSGAIIGSDGFGFVTDKGVHHKVPQVGNVIIEDDVEIGSVTAIDRATTGSTVIGKGSKLDNFVHIAHNVVVGKNCFFVAFTGISGSVKIGDNVTFAGQTGTVGHINIGGNSIFGGRSGITGDTAPGGFYSGFPARPHQEWLRIQAVISKLPELSKKIREIERKLEEQN
jgi:UDP-3-O-[3-hydroxymyristoyl] glucosamine N-acyltransferase